MKSRTRFAPHLGDRLNSDGSTATKNFDYRKEWNRKFYATKQVRPVFVEEASELVVVTVYTYYF